MTIKILPLKAMKLQKAKSLKEADRKEPISLLIRSMAQTEGKPKASQETLMVKGAVQSETVLP